MSVLADSEEFGRRLAAARGYKGEQRPAFARRIGTTDTTLLRWERGEFSSRYRTVEQRRELAERAVRASGCPPEWFELADVEPAAITRIEALARELGDLRELVLGSDDEDVRTAVQAAADAERQYGSTSLKPAERESAAANE